MSDHPDEADDDLESIHEDAQPSPDVAALAEYEQLEAKVKSGANWFFWIAALSIVNSVAGLAEKNERSFVIGLGVTQVVNALAIVIAQNNPEIATAAKVVAVMVTCIAAAITATFGFGARRRLSWVFILGMVLYAMDGLLYLLFLDFMSFAFHAFALWCMYGGLRACRQLNAIDGPVVVPAD
jgi:hypothetical protein